MINRAALILRYKEPAVRWINDADPDPDGISISLEDVNRERTIYLVRVEDGDTHAAIRRWIEDNFRAVWESELEEWYIDEESWPAERTLTRFDEWFDVECHSILIDTVDGPLIDDEI